MTTLLTSSSELDELVPLKDGLTLPLSSIARAIDLEIRGFRLRAEPDGRLVVSPGGRLTDDDRRWLREHKADVIAICEYRERAEAQPQ